VWESGPESRHIGWRFANLVRAAPSRLRRAKCNEDRADPKWFSEWMILAVRAPVPLHRAVLNCGCPSCCRRLRSSEDYDPAAGPRIATMASKKVAFHHAVVVDLKRTPSLA
jgi:hypothetical protein